jgi:hypothetical protein
MQSILIQSVLLQHDGCICVRPLITEKHVIRIIGVMEEIRCDSFTLVAEMAEVPPCVCESFHYTNSVHLFVNHVTVSLH